MDKFPNTTWRPAREFRPRFYRLRELFNAHIAGGQVNATLNFDKGVVASSLSVPGGNEALRFAQLMRPFAHPEGELFIESLVESFCNVAPLTDEEKAILRDNAEWAVRTACGLIVNRTKLTGPQLFKTIADGGLLREDPAEIQNFQIVSSPMFGVMAWGEFHGYCQRVFAVLCDIYDLLRKVEADGYILTPPPPRVDAPRCIYCCKDEGPFGTVEHVYPESLGNNDLILPVGAVCDPCNHGVCSDRDGYLADADPICLLRMLFVQINPKTGRYITAKSQRLTLRRVAPREIQVAAARLDRGGSSRAR